MVSVMLYPCIFCVALLMGCLVCCMLHSVCELFGEKNRNMFGVVVILLFNVMEVLIGNGGALLNRPYMVFHIMCVLCL